MNINKKIEDLTKERDAINDDIKTQSEMIQAQINDISLYETNAALVAEGTEESLKKVTDNILYNQQQVSDNSILTLQSQLRNSTVYLQQLEDNYKKTGSEITKKQIEEEKRD